MDDYRKLLPVEINNITNKYIQENNPGNIFIHLLATTDILEHLKNLCGKFKEVNQLFIDNKLPVKLENRKLEITGELPLISDDLLFKIVDLFRNNWGQDCILNYLLETSRAKYRIINICNVSNNKISTYERCNRSGDTESIEVSSSTKLIEISK